MQLVVDLIAVTDWKFKHPCMDAIFDRTCGDLRTYISMGDPNDKLLADIHEFGWHVVKVFSRTGGPDFAYSMFETFKHPEILIVGLAPDTMHRTINNIAMDVKSGKTFENLRDYDDILDGYECAFRTVRTERYGQLFGWAISHYKGADFTVLQCVWPDRDHRFPWDPAASGEFRQTQPTYFSYAADQQ